MPKNSDNGMSPPTRDDQRSRRRAGLAKGTVSRALNGYPDIAEATQLRVRRAAETDGLPPHGAGPGDPHWARALAGLVLNAGRSDAHKPFLTDFLDGISRAASEESWTLTVATAEDEADEVATMARLVDERKVDGFILPRTKTRDARIALLRARGVPFILFGRTARRDRLRLVRHRRRRRGPRRRPAAGGFGHQRIGYIGGMPDFNYSRLRRQGFLDGMARGRAGRPIPS
jgi:LacI family transcriptional regulator